MQWRRPPSSNLVVSHLGGRQLTHHRHNHSRARRTAFFIVSFNVGKRMVLYACASGRCFTRARRRKPLREPRAHLWIRVYFEPERGSQRTAPMHQMRFTLHVGSVIPKFRLEKQFQSRKIFMDWNHLLCVQECRAKRLSFALAGHLKSSDKEKILIYERWLRSENWRYRERGKTFARRAACNQRRGDTALLRVVIHDFQLKQLSGADRFPRRRDG